MICICFVIYKHVLLYGSKHVLLYSPKQRKPAWCDRILYMVHEDSYTNLTLDVTPIHYRNIPEYKQSDHRPVMGIYTIKVSKC